MSYSQVPQITKIQDVENSYADEFSQDFGGFISDYFNAQSRSNVIKSTLEGHLSLNGANSTIVNADVPYSVETHVDMLGRHRVLMPGESNNAPFNNHGLHTAGTVGGNGNRNPRFEGVAPKSLLYSVGNPFFPMGIYESPPARISSNSWNTCDPVHCGDWYLNKGQYNVYSQQVDELSIEHEDKIFIFSAGNSGGTQEGYPEDYLTINPSYGSSKNALVVGRMTPPLFGFKTGPSWGPTRDGRIKPGLVATTQVVATTENHTYQMKDGSSMSTPVVAGVAALLSQYFRDLYQSEPSGALLKAVLLNTADYVGNPGPSFSAGYGAVNARRAAEVIKVASYFEGAVVDGGINTFSIDVPPQIGGKSISQLKIMLYWHDPAGAEYADSVLVNNLDLSVNDGVKDHLPWVLDITPSQVAQQATKGVDTLNNVEQVAIDDPQAGTFTAQVAGFNVTGEQPFWLVYSFVLDELELTYPIGNEKFFTNETRTLFWDSQLINENRGLDSADFSLDAGVTWEPLLDFNPSQLVAGLKWTVPAVSMTKAKVRIRKDGLESESDFFTISQSIKLTLTEPNSQSVVVTWNAVTGADTYEVLQLIEGVWQVVTTTEELSILYENSDSTKREFWLSVRAINSAEDITSRRADAKLYVPNNEDPIVVNEILVDPGNWGILDIDVLSNDSDSDGDRLVVAAVTEPAQGGSVTIMDNFFIRYSRPENFAGSDSFQYSVSDNRGGVTEGLVLISEKGYDTDGDGVADSTDTFPLDATESVDTDSDGTGNNADTDDDGDGVSDSDDAFPLDSSETVDSDLDGVGDNGDAFPNDASETADTDGDGVGNNTDAFPLDATISNPPQISQIERNALIALYNSTGGANWTDNTGWLGAAGTECDWSGVTCSSGFVSSIDLYNNSLSGSIPVELGNLTNLDYLDLGNNSLSGSIPSELGNLTKLTNLSLDRNTLSGSIPTQLGDLTNLTTLDLYNNSLSGSIPAELGNLTKLTRLDLGNNSLSGSIPSELGNLTKLTSLLLGSNSLSGSIPAELGNLTNLYTLFLYSNSLSGSIPAELGNLTNLDYLDLSYNSLTGIIPSELGNLTNITLLDLNSNSLSGPKPTWLNSFTISDSAFNVSPAVTISGGTRTIVDTDSAAGESVSFIGTATDSDGTIATTQWLVDGVEVATGLSATLSLPDGSTVVTFKATDDDGKSSTTTATITITAPAYEPTEEWPSPYNGVTPDSSLGLAFNNIGVFSASDSIIYTCLRVFTDGLPGSVGGISEFDIGLKEVSLSGDTVQITKFREFNAIGALNENAQIPDCSGIFETTTGVYTDIIVTGDGILETTWSLIDPTYFIFKLSSYQELTAN